MASRPSRSQMSLSEATALAEEWAAQYEHAKQTRRVTSHFDNATPNEFISMWESWRNTKGKPLSSFEVEALYEAWLRVFGDWPPSDENDADSDTSNYSEPTPEPPANDTMLRMSDVVRLTGLSKSTIKRMVIDGRFPKPMHLSPRRRGWKGHEINSWLEALDQQRSARKH
jgi:prophage regulatory protein